MMSRILPLAFILIAIGLFFGYMKPTWQKNIAEVKADISTYDKALAAAESFFAKVDDLNREKDAIPVELREKLQSFLPDGVDNIQLILDLTELAARSNIDITNFDTPDAAEQEQQQADGEIGASPIYESLNISFGAEGTYDDFRTFLDGIERSLRPLDVTAISIAQSDTGVYTYLVTLRFYWLR